MKDNRDATAQGREVAARRRTRRAGAVAGAHDPGDARHRPDEQGEVTA